jgi:hypothetical protein
MHTFPKFESDSDTLSFLVSVDGEWHKARISGEALWSRFGSPPDDDGMKQSYLINAPRIHHVARRKIEDGLPCPTLDQSDF